jgi:nanoRNase/pAp phosphatase (c-di-AMP/oligoRNAs hydrolase)
MDPQSPAPPAQAQPNPPQDIKAQVVARLKEANNVLVTVSNNPSVDQLAAAIGFTLVLNKLKKHGTAVFSGKVPSILEFLQPEKTIEKNTDSLRDFIIALDKSKADKLRYKVEDKYVKIFITPYRTSIGQPDLEFSQGDFNVDAVIALGVKKREQLDQAITAHGRILHDATVIAVNKQHGADIGNLNLTLPDVSSLSEVMVALSQSLKGEQTDHLFDQQIATAFLTGIVAETERFSNDKTSPETMKIASVLMEAGANQQLIATKLEPPAPPPPPPAPKPAPKPSPQPAPGNLPSVASQPIAPLPPAEKPKEKNDGSLDIPHTETSLEDLAKQNESEPVEEELDEIHIDDQGQLHRLEDLKVEDTKPQPSEPEISKAQDENHGRLDEPPQHGGTLTANTEQNKLDPSSDALSLPPVENKPPLLHHDPPKTSHNTNLPAVLDEPEAPESHDTQTLDELEHELDSPHVHETDDAPLDADKVREQVNNLAASTDTQTPIAALNAQQLGSDLRSTNEPELDLPASLVGPDPGLPADSTAAGSPASPPPVPPPLMPNVSQPPANSGDISDAAL